MFEVPAAHRTFGSAHRLLGLIRRIGQSRETDFCKSGTTFETERTFGTKPL